MNDSIRVIWVTVVALTTTLPVSTAQASSPNICGLAYSDLQADFTEASAQLAPFLCNNPGHFQVLATGLVNVTNARIALLNRRFPAGSCDPDVPSPVPAKTTADVMKVLQDDIGSLPLERYCNNLADGNLRCGNGRQDAGEVCDGSELTGQTCASLGNGGGTLQCAPDCKSFVIGTCDGPAFCGNGRVDENEQCDWVNDPRCDLDCSESVCGDALVNTQEGEQCDDGNLNDDDDCTGQCRIAVCGDGILNENTEACDDGNSLDVDDCTNSCRPAFCGDGITRSPFEECDDGNNDDDDRCSNECRVQ